MSINILGGKRSAKAYENAGVYNAIYCFSDSNHASLPSIQWMQYLYSMESLRTKSCFLFL